MAGPGGTGDVLITVSIAPHPTFTLDGADVRLDLPITLYEAVLGAKVRVPTLDSRSSITDAAGDQQRPHLPPQGQGLPAKDGAGDLLATVRIVLPDKSDPELEALMKKWQTDKPYDPARTCRTPGRHVVAPRRISGSPAPSVGANAFARAHYAAGDRRQVRCRVDAR